MGPHGLDPRARIGPAVCQRDRRLSDRGCICIRPAGTHIRCTRVEDGHTRAGRGRDQTVVRGAKDDLAGSAGEHWVTQRLKEGGTERGTLLF
jgi:hypothetical protein